MKYDMQLFSLNLIESVGLTIIDTVWQGLLLGLGLFLILTFTSTKAAAIRYRVSGLTLALMFIWACYSFVNHYQASVDSTLLLSNTQYMPDANNDIIGIMPENQVVKDGLVSLLHDFLQPHTSVITGIWLFGVFFFCIRLSGGLVYIHRLKTNSTEVTDPFWLHQINRLSKRIGINPVTKLLESAMVSSPVTVGYLRPVIILPVGMLTGIPTAQLESILVHELIHIKKADYLVNLFQSVVEIIFFYHPATWFISNMIQKERENRCDQITVRLIDDPMSYARALTVIGQNSMSLAPKLTMPAHSGKGDLTRRIFNVLNLENPRPSKNRVIAALLVLLLGAGFFSFYIPEQVPSKKSMSIGIVDYKPIPEEVTLPVSHKDTETEKESSEALLKELPVDIRHKNEIETDPEVLPKKAIHPWAIKNDTVPAPKQNQIDLRLKNLGNMPQIYPTPVFYVDGQKTEPQDVNILNTAMIKSIEIFKGQDAVERFGKEGENGVVLITTNPLLKAIKKDGNLLKEGKKQKSIEIFSDRVRVDSSSIRLDGKVSVQAHDTLSTSTEAKFVITNNDYLKPPLLIIDGKVSGSSLKSLDSELSPEEIASVHVLRDQSAVALYGKKGANGVVLVTTKKKSAANQTDSTTTVSGITMTTPDITTTKADVVNLETPEIYPNPSAGVFNIRFKLDRRSKVGIQVYDLNGKLIDKVFRKSLNEGTHNITWEAADVPIGNYILHFTVGKQTIKQQIIVQK
ncbi:MAG: T9SS type A sorting domain-containing protein [Cytophagales bacterium]|nr:T9SS type A sorting domain-containing protein [Cytophagales bacterium]